jgi:hypothetical protein
LNFELIDNSPLAEFVNTKIAIIDNSAPGYKLEKLGEHIAFVSGKSGIVGVNWSEKEQVKHLLS